MMIDLNYIVPFNYCTDRNFFKQFQNYFIYLVNSIGFLVCFIFGGLRHSQRYIIQLDSLYMYVTYVCVCVMYVWRRKVGLRSGSPAANAIDRLEVEFFKLPVQRDTPGARHQAISSVHPWIDPSIAQRDSNSQTKDDPYACM